MGVFQDSRGQWYRGPDQDVEPIRQDPVLLSRGIVRSGNDYLRVPLTSLQHWQDVPEPPEPPAPQAPAPDPEEGVRFTDYARSIMAGGAQIAEGVGWLTRMAGAEDIGRSIEELGANAVDYWNSGLSNAAKDAISRDFVRKNEAGEWEWGDANLNTVGLFGAQSLLGTAAGAGAGAGITKVLQVFANPVGRAALTQAVAKGTGALPAAAAGDVAAQAAVRTAAAAAKKLQVIDKILGASGFGLGEGALGGLTAGVNVYKSVLSLPPEKVAANDRYQQIFNSTDEAMPYLERHQYAAETVAREASSLTGLQAGLTTALLGAPMGAFFGSILGKKALGAMAQTTPRAITTGAVGEAAQEAAQGAAETMISNRQRAAAGDDVQLFDDVLNQALGGAVAGAPLGGAFGAMDVQPGAAAQASAPSAGSAGAGPRSPKRKLDPLRTVAVDAFKAGVPQEEILQTVERVKNGEEPLLVAVGKLRKRQIVTAANQAATSPQNDAPEPTPLQKQTGNYKKGRLKLHGLDISIENPKDSVRKSKQGAASPWEQKMTAHYGYIRGSTDATGEHVDVFVGEKPDSQQAFIIDQLTADGARYDEPKVMLGYESEAKARAAYLSNYENGWKGLGAITAMPVAEVKAWAKSPAARKPLAWKAETKAPISETIGPVGETIAPQPATPAPKVLFETVPSIATRAGRLISELPFERRREFARRAATVIDHDKLATEIGLPPGSKAEAGRGMWQGQPNPGLIETVAGEGAPREKVEQMARAIQYVHQQDEVLWYRPHDEAAPARKQALIDAGTHAPTAYIELAHDLSDAEQQAFDQVFQEAFGELSYTAAGRQVITIDFSRAGAAAWEDKLNAFNQAAQASDLPVTLDASIVFIAETGSVKHDWQAEQTAGSGSADALLQAAAGGSPAAQESLVRARAEARRIEQEFAGPEEVARTADASDAGNQIDRTTPAEDDAEPEFADLREVETDDDGVVRELPLFSRDGADLVPEDGQLASAVRERLAKAIAEVEPLIKVIVAQSPREYGLESGVRGWAPNNSTVILFADTLAPGDEETVFAHEVFGHIAMERTPFGNEAIDMVLAMHDRGHKSIARRWDEVTYFYGRIDRVQHAKEVIARMAEKGDKHAVITRLIAAVRRFLRKLGIVREYSEAEIRELIARAGRALRLDINKAIQSPKLAALNPSSSDADILAAIDGAIPPDVVAVDKHLDKNLSRAAPADPQIQAIMDRVLSKAPEEFTLKDKVRRLWSDVTNTQALALKQGLIDSFASIEAMEREFTGGQLLDASQSAHKAALATKNLPSVMAAVMMAGVPDYVNGAYVPVAGRKGVLDIFRPLTEHKAGNLLRQWELFAAANRANRLIKEKNPDGTRRENLFTQQEIDAALTLEQKHPEFRQVLNDWNAFNKQMLDLAQDAGIIDPTSRAVWEKNDYVPFYRAIDEFATGPRARKGVANQRSQIRTLKGRDEALGNVFENMMLNVAHLLDASFKNRAMQRVVGLGIGTALQPVPFEAEAIKVTDDQLARALDKAGITVNGASIVKSMTPQQKAHWSTIFRRVAPTGPSVVSVMVNGKPEYYEVTDPLVLSSLTSMGHDSFAEIWGLFRGSKKLLTSAVTADPAFMLANFVRDTLSNWVVSSASVHPFIDAIKGVKATLANDPVTLQMMMAGAGGGGYYDANPEDIRKLIAQKVPTGAKGIAGTVIDTPAKAWHVWRKIGSAAENANRIAVFRAVLAKGGTVAEAAYQARDVLNFTMSGDYGAMRWLTQTVPFLNARVQGLYRLYRGARDNRKGFAIKGLTILAATMALALRNNDHDEYDELPEWDKDLYWHFFVGGEHYRLPKPFEVGAMFATIPERIWRTATGRDSSKILAQRLFQMAADTFAFNPVPQLVKPIIEQYANRSMFTGSPIVGQAEQNLQPEAQFTPWTSETMREFADAMPDFAPEWMRSPRRLEAAMRAYAGSMGMYVLGVSDSLVRNALGYPDEPSRKVYDFPVVQRFLKDPNPRHTKYTDLMYEMLDEANATYSTINRMRREQRFEEAGNLQKENKSKLAVRVRLNRIATQVRNINAQIRLLQLSRTVSVAEKRERIDVLVDRKNRITRQVAQFADLF